MIKTDVEAALQKIDPDARGPVGEGVWLGVSMGGGRLG
jgi:hypothetical protein